jgi:hypothetical protein
MFVLTLIEIFLIVIWLIGIAIGYTLDGFIHVFLGIAILLIISRIIAGGDGSDVS